jgi:predicted  nucleic acid-binding Zn-ribbon protein
MDKLLDPSFWETSWKTFSSAPEIAIPVLILVGGIVWWIRGVVNGREISGLKKQIGNLKEQIGSLTQQIGASEQRRLRAIEQLTVDKKKMETLREEVAALKKKIPKGGRHNELATSVDAVTSTVTELSAASERLRRRLSPSDL